MTAIVTVNVTQTIAPAPSTLQKTGAFISQGGTNTTAGTSTLLTQLADLTPLLPTAAALTSTVWVTTNVVTATTTQVHGLPLHDVVELTIAGVSSTTAGAYDGTFACTITGTSAFTYELPLASAPGAGSGGTWINSSAGEITTMAETFFSQGAQQGVYVLELGAGNPSEGVAFLESWIVANPGVFYSYLVPRLWDANPAFLTLLSQNESTTAKTYFFTTTNLQNYGNYTSLMKSCFPLIECPSYGVWKGNALTGLTYAGAWAVNDLTAIAWAGTNGGTVTATTTTAHGVQPGQQFTISGVTPAGYNTTAIALPGTTGSTLLYALGTNPGAETVLGQLNASVGGTVTATTTTAHGVLPGQTFKIAGSVGETIANGYNGTFIAEPGTTGSTLLYSVPADPGTESTDGALLASYYSSAGIPATEFSCAAPFWVTLNYDPSTTNRVTPTAFSFLFDVTPFPTQGNAAILQTLQNNYINVVGTGAEGGISDAILLWGTTRDGRDFTYWYSVDWVQININLSISNAIINGSNNTINPLYYNQVGINRLQQVAASVLSSGLTFGLVLGTVKQVQLDGPDFAAALDAGTYAGLTVINAVPFVQYSQENPSDYAIGQYAGLSCVYVPTRGFVHIIFNINVTDFVAA